YEAWRLRKPVDRPMIGILWEPDIPALPEFLQRVGDGEITPDQIHPEHFLPSIEAWYRRVSGLRCDVIPRFTPAFGIPWVEAIAGCRVRAASGSLWAEPSLCDYRNRAEIQLTPDNPWLRKLIEFTQAMVELADGRFSVAVPQMRGPLDTLAAMRTPQQMCMDMIECPQEVDRLLHELTDLWIGVGRAVLDAIPPFCRGYSARMYTYTPGPVLTLQNDISTLVSSKLYNKHVRPCDERIVRSFPFTEFHMHASEYHQLDNILSLEDLTSVEFTLEHTLGGPPLDKMMPLVKRILAKKPLVLACLDIDTARRCSRELPAEGLCLTVATSDYEIPSALADWLMDHCR
ncbi:MAG: hypothetical protein U9N87_09935, partial [Planctomycetota bacterium]|nr:hypothetical protein [Planctomycetota bacterium]